MLLVLPSAAHAQQTARRGEIRPFVGAYLPTGQQRDILEHAVLAGAQASFRALPQMAITATFGWSPSTDRVTRGAPSLDLYQYDIGVEGRATSWANASGLEFTPLLGLGIGGRTYDYRDLEVDATSKLAGYATLGGELGWGRAGVRVEARDYLSRAARLAGQGGSSYRNDITVAAGLTLRF